VYIYIHICICIYTLIWCDLIWWKTISYSVIPVAQFWDAGIRPFGLTKRWQWHVYPTASGLRIQWIKNESKPMKLPYDWEIKIHSPSFTKLFSQFWGTSWVPGFWPIPWHQLLGCRISGLSCLEPQLIKLRIRKHLLDVPTSCWGKKTHLWSFGKSMEILGDFQISYHIWIHI
jgi:hypothetical protein